MAEKTREELDSLKKSWVADPIWDIETTEGYEQHSAELLEFRLKQEETWAEQRSLQQQLIDNQKAQSIRVFCESLAIENFELGAFLFEHQAKQNELEATISLFKGCLLELDSSLKKELNLNDAWCTLIEKVRQAE